MKRKACMLTNSQSFGARLRLDHASQVNGDGHGIGYYTSDTTNDLHLTPCIYNSIIPAWNDSNLVRLAEKTRSRLVFAHIRASSAGMFIVFWPLTSRFSLRNKLSSMSRSYNSFMWMHNGLIASFDKIKRKLQSSLEDCYYHHVRGETDSEWKLQDRGVDPSQQGIDFGHSLIRAALLDTVSQLISWINESTTDPEPSLLNFCVTDGFSIVCTRYISSKTSTAASLYFISGSKFVQVADGQYKMERKDKGQDVVMIASEPLTWDPKNPWIAVPTNSVITINKQTVLMHPIIDDYYVSDMSAPRNSDFAHSRGYNADSLSTIDRLYASGEL